MPTQPPPDAQQLRACERVAGGHRHAWRPLALRLWRLGHAVGPCAKRTLDVLVAGGALLLALPLMALLALLIKATDRGPALYWQTRVGRRGRPFRFPKFRSMVVDADARRASLLAANQHGDGITFKLRHDPRITWIGRLLRRSSLDELPQLWCVLKGEMSLVGPRPALEHEVARYTLAERVRLDAVPGLTCTWQVSGRANLPFPEQVRLDIEYIEHSCLREDLRLLLKTVPAVLSGRGAY